MRQLRDELVTARLLPKIGYTSPGTGAPPAQPPDFPRRTAGAKIEVGPAALMTWQSVALVLASAATAGGCGGGDRRSVRGVGSLAVTTKLAEGVRASEASYSVTGNGFVLTGRIEIVDPAATIFVVIADVPEGVGYQVVVDATAATGQACHGSHRADVYANETTLVDVVLECQAAAAAGGMVGVNVTVAGCVRLASYSASPLTAAAGESIAVTATAGNIVGPTPLTFRWSASAGAFDNPNAATTRYNCVPGKQALTVAVSDGACSDSASIPVTCLQ
jgi:hypothetical protein